jgi:nicotinamidase-related amidase
MSTALIIIDIQNDYFENGTMTLVDPIKASENAKQLVEKFRKDHLPIIHIQHISTRPGATFFLPDTEGAKIHTNVQPLKDEPVIIKHYPNSFRETILLDHLKKHQITNLVICGMMTQTCVDSTTRAAKDFGFICTVIGDACATKDLEVNGEKIKAANVQLAFLAALNYFYATVQTTAQYFLQ